MNISARRRKNQICPCNNLGENLPRVVGYEMRFAQKVKNATKIKAHIAACKGIRKLKRSNAACKIEGVIGDLRETACPKKNA